MAECLGEELGCRIVRGVSPSTWRVNFIGSQKRGTKRATLKDLTKERCRQLGMKPQNDDEADAIGILTHAARSDERRGGNEFVSKCRSRWWPSNQKKKTE